MSPDNKLTVFRVDDSRLQTKSQFSSNSGSSSVVLNYEENNAHVNDGNMFEVS